MLLKYCENFKVVLCLFSLITVTISEKLKAPDLNEMENVFNNIQENQSTLRSIMQKLILKYQDSESSTTPDPDQNSDSCVCVKYYQCNEKTRTIIDDGRYIISSRLSEPSKCEDKIDVCCNRNELKTRISPNDQTQRCGYRYTNLNTITIDNQNKSKLGEFPWTTVIRANKSYQCVGSLIHPQVILTAAHCVNRTTSYQAVAGKLQLAVKEESLQIQNVMEIIYHPKFERANLRYDVAMLVLEHPFKLTEYVNTICLPPSFPPANYKKCVATGWGKLTSKAEKYEIIMKKVGFTIQSHSECQNNLKRSPLGTFFTLDDSFVCGLKVYGENLCIGDRGAPLACSIPGYEDRYQQVGSLSWGLDCNENPSVFIKISQVKNWIDEQFQLHNFDKSHYTAS